MNKPEQTRINKRRRMAMIASGSNENVIRFPFGRLREWFDCFLQNSCGAVRKILIQEVPSPNIRSAHSGFIAARSQWFPSAPKPQKSCGSEAH